jgi:hypothetical protein
MLERIKVLATSTVQYLVLAAVVLTAAAPLIAEVADDIFGGSTAEDVTLWITRAVAWIAGAVAIVRRVSEVPANLRGILPVDEG